MKTWNIEVQHVKAMRQGHGLVEMQLDALVLPSSTSEGKMPTTTLSLPEDEARVLYMLLKQQLAEVDKKKARSQR